MTFNKKTLKYPDLIPDIDCRDFLARFQGLTHLLDTKQDWEDTEEELDCPLPAWVVVATHKENDMEIQRSLWEIRFQPLYGPYLAAVTTDLPGFQAWFKQWVTYYVKKLEAEAEKERTRVEKEQKKANFKRSLEIPTGVRVPPLSRRK